MKTYLISIVCEGVVKELYYSDGSDMQTIRALHPNCDIETVLLSESEDMVVLPEYKSIKTRNGRWANLVRCIETGQTWKNAKECALDMGLSPTNIYKSINKRIAANGLHFEYTRIKKE